MTNIINKINEKGSLMVEALAMLGLIAMVTPVLYKKAAERTTELQDINAASEVRGLIKGVDDFLRDNYDDIVAGREVGGIDFSSFAGTGDADLTTELKNFKDYLPYGFLDADGNIQGSKTFLDYKVAVKKVDRTDPGGNFDDNRKRVLTGFVVSEPKEGDQFPLLRASRIASMVGSNGGYAPKDNVAFGVQGVWGVDNIETELGLKDVKKGSLVTASIQPISQADGDSNENVLYRKYRQNRALNTMETTLLMKGTRPQDKAQRIEGINQLVVVANSDNFQTGTDASSALLLEEDAGASIGGRISAARGNFYVKAKGEDGDNKGGETTINTTLEVGKDIDGNMNLKVTDSSVRVEKENFEVGDLLNIKNDKMDVNADKGVTINSKTADGKVELNTDASKIIVDPKGVGIDSANEVAIDGTKKVGIASDNLVDVYGGKEVNIAAGDTSNIYLGKEGGKDIAEMSGDISRIISAETNDGKENLVEARADGVEVYGQVVDLHAREDLILETDKDLSLVAVNNLSGDAKEIDFWANDYFRVEVGPHGNGDNSIFNIGPKRIDMGATNVTIAADDTTELIAPHVKIGNPNDVAAGVLTKPVIDVDTATTNSYDKTINIRRGVIDIATNEDPNADAGYVRVDRILTHEEIGAGLPQIAPVKGNPYDEYQINPAYTSVMHDIKLTTRGGARLSDILPDFINKGIYVVDNTYKEQVIGDWRSTEPPTPGANAECEYHAPDCPTSPWLGFVPTPLCPPGYARVITVMPAGFAMAQAGIPGRMTDKYDDMLYNYNPVDPFNYDDPNNLEDADQGAPVPLYFQKSTWLRAQTYPHGAGTSFKGWSTVMGFIYPYEYYKKYMTRTGTVPPGANNTTVIWNLFPTFRKELEAYATVYCYFDRNDTVYSSEYVDKYDQLGDPRYGADAYDKPSNYKNRLNDPKLNYSDPW